MGCLVVCALGTCLLICVVCDLSCLRCLIVLFSSCGLDLSLVWVMLFGVFYDLMLVWLIYLLRLGWLLGDCC